MGAREGGPGAGAGQITRLCNLSPQGVQTVNEAISIKEAAKALNISQRTVWNYIRKGKLDKVLMANKAHVTKASIERLSQSSPQTVNESISVSPGKAVVELAYLEGLLTRLGQLQAEKQYLLEHQAGQEAKERELAEARAKLAELETELARLRKKKTWWQRYWKGED